MRELLPVCHRPERGQKPDRKEGRVSANWRNLLWPCVLRGLLPCPLFCPNADENGHKTSHRTKRGQHKLLLSSMLWKPHLRSRDGFSMTLVTWETGFNSHSLSEAKTTFGFTRPKQVEPVRAEVGGKASHWPESLRPRLAGETGFREARTACKRP